MALVLAAELRGKSVPIRIVFAVPPLIRSAHSWAHAIRPKLHYQFQNMLNWTVLLHFQLRFHEMHQRISPQEIEACSNRWGALKQKCPSSANRSPGNPGVIVRDVRHLF
jgi:hypothetical protein